MIHYLKNSKFKPLLTSILISDMSLKRSLKRLYNISTRQIRTVVVLMLERASFYTYLTQICEQVVTEIQFLQLLQIFQCCMRKNKHSYEKIQNIFVSLFLQEQFAHLPWEENVWLNLLPRNFKTANSCRFFKPGNKTSSN